MIIVRIPAALRGFAAGAHELQVAPGGTVADVLAELRTRHPELLPRLVAPDGSLRPFVNVYLDRADIRSLQGLATRVPAGTVVSILPAVAGG